VTNNNDDDEDTNEEEEDNWNESYRDAGERAGESGNALNAVTYDLQRRDRWRAAYIQYFVNGCKKQKNANDTYCHLETDRLNIWG